MADWKFKLRLVDLSKNEKKKKKSQKTVRIDGRWSLFFHKNCTMQTDTASVSGSQVSSSTAESLSVHDEDDEELEQLLSLQKPVGGVSGNQSVDVAEETSEHSVCFPT